MSIAGRTYLSLQEEVLSFQFSPGKYRPLVKTWLNDAQRKAVLQSELRTQQAKASYTLEAGDDTLELPTDYARLIDFGDTEIKGLLNPVDLRELDVYVKASGHPVAYSVEGNTIALYPTPDAPYNLALRYWKLPQDMSADSDVPSIPVQYHELLVAYAMQKAYARENDYTASNFWKAEWEAALLKMRGEANDDTADGPKQAPSMWASQGIGPSYNIPR